MTTGPTQSPGVRFRVVSVLAAFVLVVSACIGDPTEFCQCPELDATAMSIDWIGDGTVPDEIQSGVRYDPSRLQLTIFFNTPDFIELQIEVEERLRAAGFDVVETTPFSGRIEEEEWSLIVRTAGGEENPRVAVFVEIVDDDARAAEILAPLVDALGTLP